MKRLLILILIVAMSLAFTPAPVEAGPLCRVLGRLKQGVGRVVGVERRQARRAARNGGYGRYHGHAFYGPSCGAACGH